MPKTIARPLLAGLLLCAGCFTAAPPLTVPPGPKMSDIPRALPPVRPEGINEQNLRSKTQEFSEELDREEQQNLLGR
jgi:hypothetical protein